MLQKEPTHRHENKYRKMSLHTVNAPLGLHLIHCHDQPESTRRAQTPAKAEELQTNMLKLVISMVMNAYKKKLDTGGETRSPSKSFSRSLGHFPASAGNFIQTYP